MTVATAKEKLEASGFNVISKTDDENSSIVTDQMPKAGAYLEAGATIYLYTSEDEVRTSVTVPDVKNKNLDEAVSELKAVNLNVVVDGTSGTVSSQSVTAGSEVEEGTVVTIVIRENNSGGQ
jgi:serine/threonine-protein kinase